MTQVNKSKDLFEFEQHAHYELFAFINICEN